MFLLLQQYWTLFLVYVRVYWEWSLTEGERLYTSDAFQRGILAYAHVALGMLSLFPLMDFAWQYVECRWTYAMLLQKKIILDFANGHGFWPTCSSTSVIVGLLWPMTVIVVIFINIYVDETEASKLSLAVQSSDSILSCLLFGYTIFTSAKKMRDLEVSGTISLNMFIEQAGITKWNVTTWIEGAKILEERGPRSDWLRGLQEKHLADQFKCFHITRWLLSLLLYLLFIGPFVVILVLIYIFSINFILATYQGKICPEDPRVISGDVQDAYDLIAHPHAMCAHYIQYARNLSADYSSS